jgi:hypothetical protein
MTQTARSKSKRPTTKKKGPRKNNVVLLDVSPNPTPTKPRHWEDIKLGSLVLAWDRSSEGYYPGIVINEVEGLLRVKFRDYPKEQPVTCRREELALLRPGEQEPEAA